MFRPGPRLIQGLLALAAAAAVAVPLVRGASVVVAGAAVALAGATFGEYRRLRRVALHVDRPGALALALDEEEETTIGLRTDADVPVRISVRQVWPRLLDRRSSTGGGLCRPGEVLVLPFRIRGTARGTGALEPPYAALTIWGLAERTVQAGASGEVSVLPNLKAVRRYHRQLNQYALRGLGGRVSPRLGKGREFERLRDYVAGDDIHDIAWKASARHGTLIVREHRLDRSQDVLLCLDRGHRMAARVQHLTKVDYAVNAAVLLAYLCGRMEDRIGMLAFGADVDKGVPQGRGPAHGRRLTAFATGVAPEYIHTDYLALAAHLRRRLRQRTLILIMTDLPEGDHRGTLVRAVRLLTPQHLPLVVIVSDPDLEAVARLRPVAPEELSRTLVARDVWTGRQQVMQELRRRGALVVDTRPEDLRVDALNAYIDVKRRQLL